METIHVTLEGRSIPLAIRRHRRARRISLRLSPARDAVVMTLPVRASVASGMAFFSSKTGWVLNNVEEGAGIGLHDGSVIPLLGRDCVIRHIPGRGVSELAGGELLVHGAPEFVSRRVRDFVKRHLQRECATRAQAMAESIGKTVREVRIRDTRSRWGSCSTKGTLTFHWQLAFAPETLLDYLVAHEVAHLKEMNHGQRFWQVVAQLYPDHLRARKWLKANGHRLHRFGT